MGRPCSVPDDGLIAASIAAGGPAERTVEARTHDVAQTGTGQGGLPVAADLAHLRDSVEIAGSTSRQTRCRITDHRSGRDARERARFVGLRGAGRPLWWLAAPDGI